MLVPRDVCTSAPIFTKIDINFTLLEVIQLT